MTPRECGETLQVGENFGRSGHVERAGWLEKIALGVDVDKDERAFEHFHVSFGVMKFGGRISYDVRVDTVITSRKNLEKRVLDSHRCAF